MFGITDFTPFLFPICVGFYLVWKLWTGPSEPERHSSTVQYQPPENLTPGECGALLQSAADVRLITATIVDLSVKGYLGIEHTNVDGTPGEQGSDTDYYFHLIEPMSEWQNLKQHERQVISAIFIPTNPLQMLTEAMDDLQKAGGNRNPLFAAGYAQIQAMTAATPGMREIAEMTSAPKSSAGLSELRTHFPLHLPRIRKAIFDALQAGGYYTVRPDQVRLLYAASAILMGLLVAAVGAYLGKSGAEWFPWILSAVITAIMIWVVGMVLPARSAAGMRALGKVRGFQDFLARVEKGRLEKLTVSPEMFEKYLPYAMALGVDSRWAAAFANIAVPPPQWYRGKNSNFLPAELVNGLHCASGQMEMENSAAPSE